VRLVTPIRNDAEIDALKAAGADVLVAAVAGFSAAADAVRPAAAFAPLVLAAQAAGLEVYAAFTAPVHEDMLRGLAEAMKTVADAGVAAIVAADSACIRVAQDLGIAGRLIYQPGTFNSNRYDPAFFRSRGLKGVTLSREITLAQIVAIAENNPGIEISLVGHGHLPMFHSRRRFLSDDAEHRGNGVRPADGSRFALEEEKRPGRHFPVVEDESGTTLFRDRMLVSFAELPVLAACLSDFFLLRRFTDDAVFFAAIAAYRDPSRAAAFLAAYGTRCDSGFYHRKTTLAKEDRR